MSLPRESEGSTKIARQTPINRIFQRTRNSAPSNRVPKNGRAFDPHAFLATIGEGRKAHRCLQDWQGSDDRCVE
jgi:hypothetical protein